MADDVRIIASEIVEAPPGPPCKTAEQMEALCCEPVGKIQCCEEVVEPEWQGYTVEEVLDYHGIVLDDQGRDETGDVLEIRFVPRKNPCGKLVNRYTFKQKNCCEDVAPLVYDSAGSPAVIAPGTRVIVGFAGGVLPALVKVRGAGITLDGYRTRDAWTYTRRFRVYAGPDACGVCTITIDDGCTKTTGYLRSTAGYWSPVFTRVYPTCLGMDLFPSMGLTDCSSYSGDILTGYQSKIENGYWVGPSRMTPGTIGPVWVDRRSSSCGHWAGPPGGSAGDVIEIPLPETPGLKFMALWGMNDGPCNDGSHSLTMFLYCNPELISCYQWVC